MAVMMYPTILATAILIVPAITGKHAERDMWLSPVWASCMGFFTVYLAYRLHRLYPQLTLIQYCEKILGRIAGKLLGFLYLFFFLHVNGIILREYGEFVVGNFLTRTPMIVVIVSMVLVCVTAVRGGVEVIGRAAEVFGPVVTVFIVLMFLLLIPDLKLENMLPIMEKGIGPSLMGAIVPMSWFSEFFLVSFLFPFLADQEKGLRWGMIAVFGVMLTLVLSNLAALFLLDELSGRLTYPVMTAARYISIAEFMEHLESIVMAMWVAGTFVKISVFFYVLSLGTAQWLGLSDYRPLVLPLGFLLVLFAIWSSPTFSSLSHFIGTSGPFYLALLQTFVPTCLLLIAILRSGRKGRKRSGGARVEAGRR
ncbi:endospore germination permease [Bacillaceae bacterium]